jgi:hypothetical protein
MRLPDGILNVECFGVTENYLNFTKKDKIKICDDIITASIKSVKSEVPIEIKFGYVYNIFDKNEKYYADKEAYEISSLFFDLKNVLEKKKFKSYQKESAKAKE